MKKLVFVLLIVTTCYAEYFGNCAPVVGVTNNETGDTKIIEPIFLRSACPTRDELNKGIENFLKATNQEGRKYVVIEKEHWYLLHFTDE